MKSTLFVILFSLSAIITTPCLAQEKERVSKWEFSKWELSNDIDSICYIISDIHPFMFTHVSRGEFEKAKEEIKQSLRDSMTILEFYRQVAPLVNLIGDGHTVLSCPFGQIIENNIKVFPFLVNINKTDTVVSVDQNWSGNKDIVPSKATILNINGIDIKEIMDECLSISEGELFHFKIEVLNKVFPLIFSCISNNPHFSIRYQYQGKVFDVETPGIDAGQYMQNLSQFRITDYSLSIDKKTNTAIIRFDEFGFEENVFKNFLDSTFLLLKNESIKNLIIDLRYNGGGVSTRGDELFQYISPVPFQQFGKSIVKVGDVVYQRYDMKSKGIWIEEKPLIPLADNPLRFKGNVYLLTSNFTFSSAASFANSFKYYKMGKLIGEETGGLAVCFANVFPCVLPNTGLNFGVSWQKYYLYGATEEQTRGVVPDIIVPAEEAMSVVLSLLAGEAL